MKKDVIRDRLSRSNSRASSISEVYEELAYCRAKLYLPKKSEHFISDIHGEFEKFEQLLKVSSGVIYFTIDYLYSGHLSEDERSRLISIISKTSNNERENISEEEFYRLVEVASFFCSQHAKRDVKNLLIGDFSSLLEELIYLPAGVVLQDHCDALYRALYESGCLAMFTAAFTEFIRRVCAPKLHVAGDIFDRGPKAEAVVDALIEYGDVDIQWGNHDVIWMGAACGNVACMANVLRISLRYANIETLEQGYGISLRELISFSLSVYGDDPCDLFAPKLVEDHGLSRKEQELIAKMHKAIAIIQFKLEGQIIQRRPHYQMESRMLLDKMDLPNKRLILDGVAYEMLDNNFPTVDPTDPYRLTPAESALVEKLSLNFQTSRRLAEHTKFLFDHGQMYLTSNNGLVFHGCIPLTEEGEFREFIVGGEKFHGREFLDRAEELIRLAYHGELDEQQRAYCLDVFWYLWTGPQSPLFGKEKMATFERYFLADKEAHKEGKNPYYRYHDDENIIKKILKEFSLSEEKGYIVNGHVPVKVKKGESPIKANGKLLVIDGGLSAAYQRSTGIGGYTLISNANGIFLVEHEKSDKGKSQARLNSHLECVKLFDTPLLKKDSDEGVKILDKIRYLQEIIDKQRSYVNVNLFTLVG